MTSLPLSSIVRKPAASDDALMTNLAAEPAGRMAGVRLRRQHLYSRPTRKKSFIRMMGLSLNPPPFVRRAKSGRILSLE
jgi:hypothetical protein